MESVVHDKPLTLPVRNLENERLCDEFYDRASVALDRLHRPGMMNSEETNGFLVALACESSVADPEDYIGLLAGEEFLDNSSDANYDEYLGLLTEHMALIRRILDNGEIFIPLLLSDEPGEEKGNDWAHGFARCLAGTDSWKRLMDDEEHWQLLTPMLVLDTENDPLPDEPPRPPVTSELRQKLLASISISVGEIYKYFEPDRREEAAEKEYFPVPLPPIDPGERADLTRVDRLLGRLKAVGAVDLEALDGFLTAIICGPSTLQPQDAIPQIFGGVPISFPEKELREICDFIVRRYNEIAQTLDDGQPLQLIVRNNPAGKLYAEEWASGFALGMRMNGGRWEPLLKNGPRHALMPIFMLDTYAIENCPESERENLQDPAKRRVALSAVPASVSAIDLFFGPDRPSWTEVATVRRAEPKQGRNDPCACGSGKKYKKCCGA